jgi:propionate CoA-transferase
MVRVLVEQHYHEVVRYASSGFLRAKLGPALAARGVVPRLYETAEAARAGLGVSGDGAAGDGRVA